jgi:hypothetical protein
MGPIIEFQLIKESNRKKSVRVNIADTALMKMMDVVGNDLKQW